MQHLEEILENSVRIPTLPRVYIKINEAINNPRTSLADIGRIISRDAGLSARLLRLANSAFYSFPNRVDSITPALVRIGTRELQDFVLGTTIISMFKGIDQDLVNMESFWRHNIATALAARVIGTFRRDTSSERLFLIGLIHDIGRILIYKYYPEHAREILKRCHETNEFLFETETQVLGFNHATAGTILLRKWNFPDKITEAVAFHHSPRESRRYPAETAVLHLADIIVHAMEMGTSGETLVPAIDANAWKIIDLSTGTIPSVMDRIENQVDEVIQSIMPD